MTNINDEKILEGFLCPICKDDFKTPDRLTNHVETYHSEEQDVVKSLKDIFITAKRKILSSDDYATNSSNNNNNSNTTETLENSTKSNYNLQNALNNLSSLQITFEEQIQDIGPECDHISYFKKMRDPLLGRYATETNKIIIRLDKLLKHRPSDPVQRKQHEQSIVPWFDGKLVNLCPGCAKKFHLTRRRHHCRLCGSIMCTECSRFLSDRDASLLVNPITPTTQELPAFDVDSAFKICHHCYNLLLNRKEMQDSRAEAPITLIYNKIQNIKIAIKSDIVMYVKMINNLFDGESIFTLSDANALHNKIARAAEMIDLLSKSLIALKDPSGGQNDALKKTIRLACIKYIQEEMLSIPPVPSEREINKLQEKRKRDAELRIEREQQVKLNAGEKYELINVDNNPNNLQISNIQHASGSAVASLDNWIGRQTITGKMNDPLIEQINIIKGYIKQARDGLRFDEVFILETNLRELQQEFYNRQINT